MNYARDVLNLIGRGLQQGIIKSPDIEMMLADGPKRVPLVQLVAQALADLPPPFEGPDAEQIPEPARSPLTPPSAHPALAAANDWAELTAAWDKLPFGTRAYYDGLTKCDAAWERIAAACVPSKADCADLRAIADYLELDGTMAESVVPRRVALLRRLAGQAPTGREGHDYPACALFRGGKCTCDAGGPARD
jgi:hypothetical protein